MEINRSLLRYEHMIASRELKPELCFSCMDCNDICKCGTGANWILDSGASKHFTSNLDDFSLYEEILSTQNATVQTAGTILPMVGKGAVIIRHNVEEQNTHYEQITHLYPVFCIPNISVQLLSMGIF